MKKKFLAGLLIFSFLFVRLARADEGMWLPLLLKQLNESDMQRNGLKLSAEDIYSINKSSLKDAIVQFNGGCTAEVISSKGLILTNHHCGYSQIQAHSSVEKDYLTNGFWAMNTAEELPNPGVTATFIVRMEDVTEKVLKGVNEQQTEQEKEAQINSAIAVIQKDAVANTHYGAFVRPFFYGNAYYLFVTETFKDIRLVGAPPSSIGKFGGDTDNWMWPRHTGDFSVFRIYANKNNEPAEYSPDNVPYQPKYVIPISLKGEEQGDFTMVYGFPGRTSEYLSSYAVNMIQNQSDPDKVKIRAARLAIWEQDMAASDAVRIQYAAKYASLANYWKKWAGEINGLKKGDAINKKKNAEQEFMIKVNADDRATSLYGGLFPAMEKAYTEFTPLNKQRDYLVEAILGIEAVNYAFSFTDLTDALQSGKSNADLTAEITKLKAGATRFFKDYHASTDEKICAAMLKLVAADLSKDQQASVFAEIQKKYDGDFQAYARSIYKKSMFVDQEKMNKFLNDPSGNWKKMIKDPIYQLMASCYNKFATDVRPKYNLLDDLIGSMNKKYMKGMLELLPEKKFYPDANSTLRVAYGKVNGYDPRDGVSYKYFTTIDGMMAKENSSVDEFVVSDKMKELYAKKDYGPYADKNGDLRIAFCASNHTTGGNSGSPVFNGEGQLIGTNFDRNWEGTMSDILYDPNQVRNIILDVRFTLFVIDKYAGAGYLLNEMNLVKNE